MTKSRISKFVCIASFAFLATSCSKTEMEPTVTVYDPDTESYTEVPESELAPGMIQVKIKGHEGLVWIEPSELKQSEYRHPPFTGPRREKIAKIQSAFPEIYDNSYEFWEDGFRRDENPDNEIKIWLHIATVYSEFASGKSLEYRDELFRLVLACSNSGRDQLKNIFEAELIAPEQIEAVASSYYRF